MTTALKQVFDHCRQRITLDDVRRYVPNDPGVYEYISQWESILESAMLPSDGSFEISEVISSNGYSRVVDAANAASFLNYRIWLMTIAVHVSNQLQNSEEPWPTNYVALCMLNDIRDLGDPPLCLLFGDVAAETSQNYFSWDYPQPESLFWAAAEMVWAHRHQEHSRVIQAAGRLIDQETCVAEQATTSADFLFGRTVYDQRNWEWRDTLREVTNCLHDETLQLVLDSLDLTNRRKLERKR